MRKLNFTLWALLLLVALCGAARAEEDADRAATSREPARMEVSEAPRSCPVCGKKTIAPIMYGLPNFTEELERDVREGKIVLGGCVVTDHDPQWKCTSCGALFYREHLSAL